MPKIRGALSWDKIPTKPENFSEGSPKGYMLKNRVRQGQTTKFWCTVLEAQFCAVFEASQDTIYTKVTGSSDPGENVLGEREGTRRWQSVVRTSLVVDFFNQNVWLFNVNSITIFRRPLWLTYHNPLVEGSKEGKLLPADRSQVSKKRKKV